MSNNQLTPEDNKTIELIDERLKQLNIDENSSVMLEFLCRPDISQKIVKMLDGEKQPSPAKDEVEYVRCVKSVLVFTEGHIYKLSSVSANNIEPFVMYNGIQWCSYAQYRMFFMPASEEEYQAQQQVEWKVGEWCKTSLGKIFFIEEVGKGILGSTQENENDTILVTQEAIKFCTKPTEQEIFNHLRGIAEKKYPVGTKLKDNGLSLSSAESNGIVGNGYRYSDNELWVKDNENEFYLRLYYNGKWADVITEPQRWKPKDGEVFYRLATDFKPIRDTWGYSYMCEKWYEAGNCFQTEIQANEIRTKIKEILK